MNQQSALPFEGSWRSWFPETLEGFKRAEENADSEWFCFALMCLCRVAKEKRSVTADDVADYMQKVSMEMPYASPQTHEKRAMGPVMVRGAKFGWITKTDAYDTCRRSNQHNCPKRIWISNVYGRRAVKNGTNWSGQQCQ